jgi:dodecin
MSVAKVIEVIAKSKTSFDDAVKSGIAEAAKSLKGISGAWVKDQSVDVKDGKITGYTVVMKITFVLETSAPAKKGKK